MLLMMFACGARSRDASIISTRRVSLRVIKSSKVGRASLLQRLLLSHLEQQHYDAVWVSEGGPKLQVFAYLSNVSCGVLQSWLVLLMLLLQMRPSSSDSALFFCYLNLCFSRCWQENTILVDSCLGMQCLHCGVVRKCLPVFPVFPRRPCHFRTSAFLFGVSVPGIV